MRRFDREEKQLDQMLAEAYQEAMNTTPSSTRARTDSGSITIKREEQPLPPLVVEPKIIINGQEIA